MKRKIIEYWESHFYLRRTVLKFMDFFSYHRLKIFSIPIFVLLISYIILRSTNYYINDLKQSLEFSSLILSALASIFTLIIALLLYDRLGTRSKTIENQMKIVLELIDFMRTNKINVETFGSPHNFEYFIWYTKDQSIFRNIPGYENNKNKFVALRYGKHSKIPIQIQDVINDLWLPSVIMKKLEFIQFKSGEIIHESKVDKSNYVFLKFGKENQEYLLCQNEMTYEHLLINIEDLVSSIKKWVKQNANIKIDLNFSVKTLQ
jgi:hypothetical protein